MAKSERINDDQAGRASDEVASLLDGITDRIGETMEGISELADDIEELSTNIKQLLDDLRAIQSRLKQENREKLEPLIDQLEGVSRELENAVWTMDSATEGLPEDRDVVQILQQPVDNVD